MNETLADDPADQLQRLEGYVDGLTDWVTALCVLVARDPGTLSALRRFAAQPRRVGAATRDSGLDARQKGFDACFERLRACLADDGGDTAASSGV